MLIGRATSLSDWRLKTTLFPPASNYPSSCVNTPSDHIRCQIKPARYTGRLFTHVETILARMRDTLSRMNPSVDYDAQMLNMLCEQETEPCNA